MNPTVSIVVPIYNAQEYLEKSINSVLTQTYSNLEIVLVNDGSTDKSPEICRSFAEKDDRIKLINKENGGGIAARRTGRENASGEYIMFSDADDLLSEDAVQVLLEAILREDADIAVARLKRVQNLKSDKQNMDDLGNYIKDQTVYEGEDLRQKLLKSFLYFSSIPCNLVGKIYKKALFHDVYRYAEGIKFYGDDLHIVMALFANAEKVVLVDKVVYFYRPGGGTSRHMPTLFNDLIWGYKNKLKMINDFHFEDSEKLAAEYFLALIEAAANNLFLDKTLTNRERFEKLTEYINDPTVRLACDKADYDRLRPVERMVVDRDVKGLYKHALKTVRRSKYIQIVKKTMARFG